MAVAGKLSVRVVQLEKGPHYAGFFQADTTDPYIKLTLHDGKFDQGGSHVGETVKTTAKQDAGTAAKWDELFNLNKPENMGVMRVELWDDNVLVDDLLGSLDVDLDRIFAEENILDQIWGNYLPKQLNLVKDGKETAIVDIEVKIVA